MILENTFSSHFIWKILVWSWSSLALAWKCTWAQYFSLIKLIFLHSFDDPLIYTSHMCYKSEKLWDVRQTTESCKWHVSCSLLCITDCCSVHFLEKWCKMWNRPMPLTSSVTSQETANFSYLTYFVQHLKITFISCPNPWAFISSYPPLGKKKSISFVSPTQKLTINNH